MSLNQQSSQKENLTLAKAFLNAAEQLGLKQHDLAKVLGVDSTVISRLKTSDGLEQYSKRVKMHYCLSV